MHTAVQQVVYAAVLYKPGNFSYMYFFILHRHTPLDSISVTVCLVHMDIECICGQRQCGWFNR